MANRIDQAMRGGRGGLEGKRGNQKARAEDQKDKESTWPKW